MIANFLQEHYFFIVLAALVLFCMAEQLICGRWGESVRKNRWPHNIGLWLLNCILAAMLPIGAFASAHWAHENSVGFLNNVTLPYLFVVLFSILIRSLAQYCFHRLMHGIPIFWAIHQVHHSDNALDSSTSLRFHPIELALNIAFLVPLVIVFGLNAIVLLVFELALNLYGLLGHTRLPLPTRFSKVMRYVLITPALHRLHHSDYIPETNSNFSADFSCWDRIFGTYLEESARSPSVFRVGLSDIDTHMADNFEGVFWSPFSVWHQQIVSLRRRRIARHEV